MSQPQRSVFISYRRIDMAWALAIRHQLIDRGHDVFVDVQSLKSGDFDQVLCEQIRARANFLLLLTPNALDRCPEPDDWLLRELQVALESRRNIVPVLLEGFSFDAPTVVTLLGELPPLALLKKYNALTIPSDYFDEGIQRLCSRFLAASVDTVLHPPSEYAQKQAASMQAAAERQPAVSLEELAARERAQSLVLQAFSNRADRNTAERQFAEAIAMAPRYLHPRLARAVWRELYRDLEGAIEDYTEAMRLDPQDARYVRQRGGLHASAGRLDQALRDYDRACELDPGDGIARAYRGDVYARQGRQEQALADFNEAVRLAPRSPLARKFRATALIARGQFGLALEDLNQASNEQPDNEYTWMLRVQAHEGLGDAAAATADRAWLAQIRQRKSRRV